jgi:hypothetical protein
VANYQLGDESLFGCDEYIQMHLSLCRSWGSLDINVSLPLAANGSFMARIQM